MKHLLLSLAIFAALVGCGGSNGSGQTTGGTTGSAGYPEGRLDGTCQELNGKPYGCWLEVHGQNVEWGLQAGTRGVPGTLKGNRLHVGPYENFVNVSRNRVWLDGRLDVVGGKR